MAEIKKANGHRLATLWPVPETTVEAERRPRSADYGFDLDETLAAVFALETKVPEDAFTASGLGTERHGSAVLISDGGLFLTIGYLVTEAEQATLVAGDGRSIPAHVVGYDHETGFGLVQAHEEVGARPVRRGGPNELAESSPVIVAGHGGNASAQVSSVVSKRVFAGYWEYLLEEAIFTAPPHPNWSGAALFDADGTMRGLGSLYVQDAEPGEQLMPGNMFVPLDILDPILDDLVTIGRPRRAARPWLGMYLSEVDGNLVVAGLAETGPANVGGVRVGDLVLGVSGQPVAGLIGFLRRVRAAGDAGVAIDFSFYRDGSLIERTITSGNRRDYLKRPQSH